MNQQPFNNPPGQTPPPAGSPFEAPQQTQAPAPTGQPPAGYSPAGGFQPTGMEPASGGKSSWVLIIILVVILIIGALVFASWEGWITLGGVEKLWKKGETTTTTTTETAVDTTAETASDTNTNANDTKRKQDLANLKAALKKYYEANQAYPVAATVEKTSDTNGALAVLVPTYIAALPVDPLSPTNYYGYKSDGKTFEITAALEDKTDPAGIQSGTFYLYKVTDSSTETPATTTTTPETPATTTDTTTNTNQ